MRFIQRLAWAGILLLFQRPAEWDVFAAELASPASQLTQNPATSLGLTGLPGESGAMPLFGGISLTPQWMRMGGASMTVESPALSDPLGMLGLGAMTPQDAHLKIGNAYFRVNSVSGSMLYSDNINWSSTPESGYIAVARLNATMMYQFSDNLTLAVGGSLIYLPTQGEFGVSGFGIQDPLYAFSIQPLFRARLAYEFTGGEWQFLLADEYRIYMGVPYAAGLGFEFQGRDVAGNYVFENPNPLYSSGNSFLYKDNTTAASATRLLPTETRLTVGASRSEYWYDGNTTFDLPTWRNSAYVALNSELEELRFKPFAYYRVDQYDLEWYDHQQVRAGFRGPLTENLSLLADGGYYWAKSDGHNTPLWGIQLSHEINPVTVEYGGFGRYVVSDFGDLETRLFYGIRHQVNSVVTVGGEAHWSQYESLDPQVVPGSDFGASAGVQAAVLSGGGVYLGMGWDQGTYDSTQPGTRSAWSGRVGVRYRTLQADLTGRWTSNNQASLRYLENMVMLTLTKYF